MLVGKSTRRVINRKTFVSLAFLLAGFLLLSTFLSAAPSPALAQTDLGLNEAARIGLDSSDPRVIIVRVIQAILGFLGLIAVSLIIYAGFVMMTSGGNAEKVEQAKKILKNAIIGLIIILSSFAIVSFLLNKLTGSIWGGGDDGGDDNGGSGLSALGNGIIRNVYPEPGQNDVVRNTSIIVTFREKMDPATICDALDGSGNCSPDAKIKNENIRIFETDRGDACLDKNCGQNITEVRVSTIDNETFVFQPLSLIGSPSANIWHAVKLTEDLKKADDSPAFGGLSNGFEWSFEVSTKIDLTPPQVKEGGVFPAPDNERDEYSETSGAKAAGSIEIKASPRVYSASSAGIPVKDPLTGIWPAVKAEGEYNCLDDGEISVTIGGDSDLTVTASSPSVKGLVSGDSAKDGIISIGCGISLAPISGSFSAGNKWKLTVAAEKQADTLKVGSLEFVFVSKTGGGNKIKVGNNAQTAANIIAALAGHPEIAAGINAGNNKKIDIAAKNAGSSGNSIELKTSNEAALQIEIMQGGKDRETAANIKGRGDKARNAVIQVNFNEAINPLTISGNAGDVKNYIKIINAEKAAGAGEDCSGDSGCLSYKCEAGKCVNDYLDGKFIISNQYNTAEFVSNIQCGVNACGEAIYCLPELSHLKAVLKAAVLDDCGTDNCAQKIPFNICGNGICKDSDGKKYPLSKMPLEGIVDMAMNSLDGNRNSPPPPAIGFADGPEAQSGQVAYDENYDSAGSAHGDDFIWSFFISDEIDLTPPAIKITRPAHNGKSALYKEIEIEFNELMMSGSLATGEKTIITIKNDPIEHKLINLTSFTAEKPGYWISKTDIDNLPPAEGVVPAGDGEPDWTMAILNHSGFSETTKYRAQVGSGVKDIYQNCFMPCSSSACQGNPSCCGEAPTIDVECKM